MNKINTSREDERQKYYRDIKVIAGNKDLYRRDKLINDKIRMEGRI